MLGCLVRLVWGQVPGLNQTAYYWVVGGHSSLTVAVVGPSATHGGGATQRRAGRRAQGGVYIATCAGTHAKCIHNHATHATNTTYANQKCQMTKKLLIALFDFFLNEKLIYLQLVDCTSLK